MEDTAIQTSLFKLQGILQVTFADAAVLLSAVTIAHISMNTEKLPGIIMNDWNF
jgi:hypothetical protein